MVSPDNCLLVVMAKAPVAGQVKTRLIPDLGDEGALNVYRKLLRGTLQRASKSDRYARELSCSPDIDHPEFTKLAQQYGFILKQQPHGDLGQRMSQIIDTALDQYQSVVIIGSDLINIEAHNIEQAFESLQQANTLVLGTTNDGGYGLIGLSQSVPSLFADIPWSTSKVTELTLQRAQEAGLEIVKFEGLQDIDTCTDYEMNKGFIESGYSG